MTTIDNLTGFADQQTVLILDSGLTATLELVYNGATERWTMNLNYNGKAYNGIGICDYPNVLRQWKNILPFGVACATSDQTDPFNINDFATGRVTLYLLTAADVLEIEVSVFGAPQ